MPCPNALWTSDIELLHVWNPFGERTIRKGNARRCSESELLVALEKLVVSRVKIELDVLGKFDRVIVAGVNDGILPLKASWISSNDTVILKESETQERALLYVAATRAKKEVIVTGFGTPSRFICS